MMYKMVVLTLVATLGCQTLARADWVADFEPDVFTEGSLQGQQGWTAPYGEPTALVVLTPGIFPASAGSQVIRQNGDAAVHSTAGIGLTKTTHFSGMLAIGGSPTGYQEFDWFRDQPGTDPGFEIGGLGGWQFGPTRPTHFFVRSANGHVSSPEFTGPIVAQVDATIDFTNQRFESIFTDVTSGGSGGILWDSGWQPFSNPTTLTQANNNSQLWLNTSGDQSSMYMDNISFTAVAIPDITGDVNHDGIVDVSDIQTVAANYLTAGPTGDANHDGFVDISDVQLIAAHWLQTSGGSGSAIPAPEPSTLALIIPAMVGGLAYARRKPQHAN